MLLPSSLSNVELKDHGKKSDSGSWPSLSKNLHLELKIWALNLGLICMFCDYRKQNVYIYIYLYTYICVHASASGPWFQPKSLRG